RPPEAGNSSGHGSREPSYPDRRRLDSDVRAFMRQPSTPCITFDRDSKVAAGEMAVPRVVLSAFRSSTHDGLFAEVDAAPPVIDAIPEPTPSTRPEPSSLIVTHDIQEPSLHAPIADDDLDGATFAKPRLGTKLVAMAAAAGVTVLALAGVLALRTNVHETRVA